MIITREDLAQLRKETVLRGLGEYDRDTIFTLIDIMEKMLDVALAAKEYRLFAHVYGPEAAARHALDVALGAVGLSGNTGSTMTASNDKTNGLETDGEGRR